MHTLTDPESKKFANIVRSLMCRTVVSNPTLNLPVTPRTHARRIIAIPTDSKKATISRSTVNTNCTGVLKTPWFAIFAICGL